MADELGRLGLPEASFGSYRRYESGQKSPSVAILRGIAAIVGVEAWEILAEWQTGLIATSFPEEIPQEGLQILGHLDAELSRFEEGPGARDRQVAFEVVDQRVEALRAKGSLDAVGYAYWCAIRRGAVLSGGYVPADGARGDAPSG